MSGPIQILVLSDDPARVRQWRDILAERDTQVWHDVRDIPRDCSPDVIVTDGKTGVGPVSANGIRGDAWPAGEVGVVSIGEIGSGDVSLPEDFTPRELRLACRLLSEVIRWRRECRQGRQLQQTLSQLALTDPLTGLPNRRAWDEETRRWASRGGPDSTSLCLALFDLDHFKSINDRFGHIAGDEILCHVGRRLAAGRRDSDVVARLGGDEFALLLAGREPLGIAAEIESLRTVACDGTPHTRVTACMGFAISAALPTVGLDVLFNQADAALRRANSLEEIVPLPRSRQKMTQAATSFNRNAIGVRDVVHAAEHREPLAARWASD